MAKLYIKNTDGTFAPHSSIAVTNLDIVQDKGDSLTSAMSQKSVTEALKGKQPTLTDTDGGYGQRVAELEKEGIASQEKLTELEKEIGIVKGHYTGTNTFIFDKSQIAAGSKIKVSFVLYHPTGKVAVYDADDKELKGFYITNGTIGQNYTFDSYVLPENYESVKIARWGDLDVEILVESLNPKHIAQSVAELESQVSELESNQFIKGVDITIPNKIIAVEGDTLQIFWRSIVGAVNPYIFDIYAVCSVGKSFPRYYEFKPTADMVGKSYNLEVYVKTNNGTIVAQKAATIKVVSTMDSPSSTKNILCIGASATAGGQWVGELNRRLTATSGDGTPANPTGLGLSNIAFVGRKVGTSNSIHLEATGGWRVQDYAGEGQKAVRFFVSGVDTISLGTRYSCNGTIYVVQEVNVTEGVGNIRCTLENAFVVPSGKLVKQSGSGDAEITFTSYEQEKFNPFWNDAESRLDFSSYANEYCDGHIDCMIWHCGINDITSGDPLVIPTIIEAFRNILTAYHEQFPSGKVIISSVPIGSVNGGFASNYGANRSLNYYTFAKIAKLYAQALIELTNEEEYKTFVTYSPVLEQFDAENNYLIKEVAVNSRASATEKQGTNAVHPTTEGSYQVADAIYRIINTIDMSSNDPVVISPIASKENVYIPKGGGSAIAATTSARGVASYAIETGKSYQLSIPMTGNEYAAFYAFGMESSNGVVDTGVRLENQYGIGNQQSADLQVMTDNSSYKYLYVCYTLDSGMPTLTRL